jgi:hypothetical protein
MNGLNKTYAEHGNVLAGGFKVRGTHVSFADLAPVLEIETSGSVYVGREEAVIIHEAIGRFLEDTEEGAP